MFVSSLSQAKSVVSHTLVRWSLRISQVVMELLALPLIESIILSVGVASLMSVVKVCVILTIVVGGWSPHTFCGWWCVLCWWSLGQWSVELLVRPGTWRLCGPRYETRHSPAGTQRSIATTVRWRLFSRGSRQTLVIVVRISGVCTVVLKKREFCALHKLLQQTKID